MTTSTNPILVPLFRAASAAILLTMAAITPANATQLTADEFAALFERAQAEGRVGRARKTKPVDVRPAKPGEIIITIIRGEGEETRSPPATRGDMVVRNRCPETGNEEILVKKEKFAERYEGPIADAKTKAPWQAYRPRGVEMLFFTVSDADGAFTFTAPWGEDMVAKPGDAIVRDPKNPNDSYRIAAAAFTCTYEILTQPKSR